MTCTCGHVKAVHAAPWRDGEPQHCTACCSTVRKPVGECLHDFKEER